MIASKLIDSVLSGTDVVSAIDEMFNDTLVEFAQELGGPEVGLSLLKGEIDNFELWADISGDDSQGEVNLMSNTEIPAKVGTFKWDRMSIEEDTNTYIYASHSDLWGEGKYKGRYWGVLGYLALIEHVTNKLKGYIAPFGSFIAGSKVKGKVTKPTKESKITELGMRGFTTKAASNVWKSLQSSGYIDSKIVELAFASSQVYPAHNIKRKMQVEVYYYTGPKIVGSDGILPNNDKAYVKRSTKQLSKAMPKDLKGKSADELAQMMVQYSRAGGRI